MPLWLLAPLRRTLLVTFSRAHRHKRKLVGRCPPQPSCPSWKTAATRRRAPVTLSFCWIPLLEDGTTHLESGRDVAFLILPFSSLLCQQLKGSGLGGGVQRCRAEFVVSSTPLSISLTSFAPLGYSTSLHNPLQNVSYRKFGSCLRWPGVSTACRDMSLHPQPLGAAGPVEEEIFENERYQPFRAWGHTWPGHFLPTDRVGHWSVEGAVQNPLLDSASFDAVAPALKKVNLPDALEIKLLLATWNAISE